jgi:hypothetical protein
MSEIQVSPGLVPSAVPEEETVPGLSLGFQGLLSFLNILWLADSSFQSLLPFSGSRLPCVCTCLFSSSYWILIVD